MDDQRIPSTTSNISVPTANQNSEGPYEHLQPFHIGCIVISLVIIAINSTVIYLFLTKKFLQKSISNIILFSLAISDLGFGAIALPLLIGCELTHGVMCYVNHFFTLLFGLSSVYHILLAITEKCFAICFTIKHHSMFTRSLAIKSSTCVWFLSLFIAHVPLWWIIFFRQRPEEYKPEQFIYDMFSFAATLVLPVVASATMYTMMLRKLSRQFSTMTTVRSYSITRQTSRLRNERKAALMFGVMFTVFLLCWGPWFVLTCFVLFFTTPIPDRVTNVTVISRYFASFLNPALYTFWKNDFRQALVCLRQTQKRGKTSTTGLITSEKDRQIESFDDRKQTRNEAETAV